MMKQLSYNEKDEFLKKVEGLKLPFFASPIIAEVEKQELPFYKTAQLYKLKDLKSRPAVSRYFIDSEKGLKLVEGFADDIIELNLKDNLKLSYANVCEYTKFYLSMIWNEDNAPSVDEHSLEVEKETYNGYLLRAKANYGYAELEVNNHGEIKQVKED